MGNAIIAFPNRFDEATLTGGSWSATLPRANLQDRRIKKLARTADAALLSTQFDIALTKSRAVKVLALVNHNLSAAALYRITSAEDSGFATLVSDSGWLDAWPSVYATLSLEWEDANWWDGTMLDEDKIGYTWTIVYILSPVTSSRYWRVEINDTANAAGYVQIGRVFMSGQWQPTYNMAYGDSIRFETKTEIAETPGGTEYFDSRPARRIQRFTLPKMSIDEALGRAFEIDRRAGLDGEIFYVADPDETTHMIRTAFLCRMRELTPLEFPYLDNATKAFEVQEIIG